LRTAEVQKILLTAEAQRRRREIYLLPLMGQKIKSSPPRSSAFSVVGSSSHRRGAEDFSHRRGAEDAEVSQREIFCFAVRHHKAIRAQLRA
jgi:hypothetical protein